MYIRQSLKLRLKNIYLFHSENNNFLYFDIQWEKVDIMEIHFIQNIYLFKNYL